MKKIVAIGGGENGRIDENGKRLDYETYEIDKEIIRLTEKEKPNFLFIGHAFEFSKKIQDSYYDTMKKIYKDIFGCRCKHLRSDELSNKEKVQEKINWADIIYEGGGNTDSMIKLWRKTNFDNILYKAWQDGKVICGISAGAVCWFHSCNSDTEDGNFEIVEGLNWIDLFITPHAQNKERIESSKKQLKERNKIAIMLPNLSAIEIIDEKYRILTCNLKKEGLKKTKVYKAYWKDKKFIKKELKNENKFKNMKDLIIKN
ncbi:MAG: Type 1 glutamine amidotransferase-like domain-containing protein [Bacilli bacterium]|nr:Type 1 glutamine amidotransferase-like domain-containing protein [Bacilli bacterium]